MSAQRMAYGLAALSVVLAAGCGGDGGGAGVTAGAPAMEPDPTIGQRCSSSCATGICERSGTFAGICTVNCSSDNACRVGTAASANLSCFLERCAYSCVTADDCPAGTACSPADRRMACVPDGS